MAKKIYLSHPFGGLEENREKAAAVAKLFREIWAAEGKTYELVNPIEYLAPLSEGFQEWEILKLAVNLLKSCDAVLFAPGWKKSRGCRLEHFAAKGKEIAEIPEEIEAAAVHWYGVHHIITRRRAA